MTTSKAVLIVIVATLVTSPTFAQNNRTNDANSSLLARLSYNSTWFVDADQKTSPGYLWRYSKTDAIECSETPMGRFNECRELLCLRNVGR